jgi:hypothetical protein
VKSLPRLPPDTTDAGARFIGMIEYQLIFTPFLAELTVTGDRLELRPRVVRTFRKTAASKSDIRRITSGGTFHRGFRFESQGGALDRFIFVPYFPRGRRMLREELERRGYPVID